MPEPKDDLFNEDEDNDGTDDGASTESPSPDPKDAKSSDRRVRDLQSAKDKETARANQAEARLKVLIATMGNPDAGTGKPAPKASDVPEALLDMARMFAVQQHPKLAEYGLSASDLVGSSPSEFARSAAELVARFEKIETQARNKALAENGLAPELGGDKVVAPDRDFSKMSREDFAKVMDAALSGRV